VSRRVVLWAGSADPVFALRAEDSDTARGFRPALNEELLEITRFMCRGASLLAEWHCADAPLSAAAPRPLRRSIVVGTAVRCAAPNSVRTSPHLLNCDHSYVSRSRGAGAVRAAPQFRRPDRIFGARVRSSATTIHCGRRKLTATTGAQVLFFPGSPANVYRGSLFVPRHLLLAWEAPCWTHSPEPRLALPFAKLSVLHCLPCPVTRMGWCYVLLSPFPPAIALVLTTSHSLRPFSLLLPPFPRYPATNGVVIATEKKIPSVLVDESSVEKIQLLSSHVGASAG
jgi:hypothetical protein